MIRNLVILALAATSCSLWASQKQSGIEKTVAHTMYTMVQKLHEQKILSYEHVKAAQWLAAYASVHAPLKNTLSSFYVIAMSPNRKEEQLRQFFADVAEKKKAIIKRAETAEVMQKYQESNNEQVLSFDQAISDQIEL